MNETTPPIMTINEDLLAELEAAAKSARPECCGETVSSGVTYGGQHEMICCGMHAEDHGDVEYFHDKANPATILALLQHVRELKADAERYRYLRDYLRHDYKRWESAGSWNHSNIPAAEFDAAVDAARSSAD